MHPDQRLAAMGREVQAKSYVADTKFIRAAAVSMDIPNGYGPPGCIEHIYDLVYRYTRTSVRSNKTDLGADDRRRGVCASVRDLGTVK